MGPLCFATDLVIGLKITYNKGNTSLQTIDSTVGNLICKFAISPGCIRNKVNLMPLACEDGMVYPIHLSVNEYEGCQLCIVLCLSILGTVL